MATWRQAIDNVIAGNVALSDNHRFGFVPYHSAYQEFTFDYPPSIKCEIDIREGIGTENKITFKDGSYYGFYYIGDSGNQLDIGVFAKIQNYPILGQTPKGTDYTWLSTNAVLDHFDVQVGGQTIRAYVKKIGMSFGCNVGEDNVIMEVFYGSFADNLDYGYMWNWDYTSNNITATLGEMGYLQSDSHVVDFLAGDYAEISYPDTTGYIGGGNGQFYADNDGVPFSRVPRLQLIDLGFNTIYTPSQAETRSIAEWLWTDDFNDNIKLNYVSPFDNIVMLAMCPISSRHFTTINAPFKIGNTYMEQGGQYMTLLKIQRQYLELYCGTRTIKGFWNGFLDYDSTYTIYLPFIGFRSLKTDDIINSEVTIKYNVDLLTGQAVAEVGCVPLNPETGEEDKLSVLYSFPCNVYYNMAFSGANFISQYNQQLSATASGINNFVSSIGQVASGNILGGIANFFTGQKLSERQYETAKPDYGRGGNNGGNVGCLSCRFPYIVQSLPVTQVPKDYAKLNGIPSQVKIKLSNLVGKGYTEIQTTNVSQLTNCTDVEQQEILKLLQGGVIL